MGILGFILVLLAIGVGFLLLKDVAVRESELGTYRALQSNAFWGGGGSGRMEG